MLTMTQIENQITQFSFEEQLHLLAFIANKVNISSEKSSAKTKKRSLGDLRVNFGWQKILTKPQIASRHLDELISLPNHHNDPFDRLIICQAKTENFTIITRDAIIPKYPVKTVW